MSSTTPTRSILPHMPQTPSPHNRRSDRTSIIPPSRNRYPPSPCRHPPTPPTTSPVTSPPSSPGSGNEPLPVGFDRQLPRPLHPRIRKIYMRDTDSGAILPAWPSYDQLIWYVKDLAERGKMNDAELVAWIVDPDTEYTDKESGLEDEDMKDDEGNEGDVEMEGMVTENVEIKKKGRKRALALGIERGNRKEGKKRRAVKKDEFVICEDEYANPYC